MIIPVGFAQITHFFSGAQVPEGAAITYGVDVDALLTPTDVAQAAFNAFDTSNFDAIYASTATMNTTRAKFGPVSTGPYADWVANVGGAGSAGGAAQVCTLITKQTDSGGRKNRGRFFLPAVPEANVDVGGTLTSGTITTAQAAADAFLTALDTAGIPMVILHGSVGDAPTPVTSLVVSPYVATQRRRQPRRAG